MNQLDAENIFLSSLLALNVGEQKEAISLVRLELFANKENQMVYTNALQILANDAKIDVVLLHNMGRDMVHLCDLSDNITTPFNYHIYASNLEKLFIRRRVGAIAKELVKEIENAYEPEQVKQNYTNQLEAVCSAGIEKPADIPELIRQHEKLIKTQFLASEHGFKLGIAVLDRNMGGIKKGKTYLLGARAKVGKTRFIIHCIKQCLRGGARVTFLTLEMRPEDVIQMLLSSLGNIPEQKFQDYESYRKDMTPYDRLNAQETRQYHAAQEELNLYNGGKLFIDRPKRITAESVLNRMNFYAKISDVIFIDFLTVIDIRTEGQENLARAIERYAQQLSAVAKNTGVSVFFAVQMNQNAEKEGSSTGDIKHSSGILEAVDHALILEYPYRLDNTKPKDLFTFTLRQRYGQSGGNEMAGDLSTCTFSNYGTEETIDDVF